MITRREKLLWICYAAVLVLLFLLSSTDLIIKERKTEVYPVSVIIEDTSDENYVNFRKGMERAAIELNADVSFITLYEENNQQQQLEMMAREQQDGAKALIVIPVEGEVLEAAISQTRPVVPLVLVNSDISSERVAASVTVDYFEMGQKLAKQVVKRHDSDISICLLGGMQENTVTRQFEEGIRSVLLEAGNPIIRIEKQDGDTLKQAVEEYGCWKDENVVVIALNQTILAETASLLSEDSQYEAGVAGLYGRGTTIPILNYLDREVISGICVTDDFSAGYLSIKRAVEAVTRRTEKEKTLLESYYIEKADLRRAQYEKMLYPIE